jgi:hypothetical protein
MSFKAVAKSIASKQGIPMKNADAILAAGSRNSSAKAKKANPKLNKVKGKATSPIPSKKGKASVMNAMKDMAMEKMGIPGKGC